MRRQHSFALAIAMLVIAASGFRNNEKNLQITEHLLLMEDTVYKDRNGNVIRQTGNGIVEKVFVIRTTMTTLEIYGPVNQDRQDSDRGMSDSISPRQARLVKRAIKKRKYSQAHATGNLVELYPLSERKADYEYVKNDNGLGDTIKENNREYCIEIDTLGIRNEFAGPVKDPSKGGAYVDTKNMRNLIRHSHSHPSGTKTISGKECSFGQPPSLSDIKAISSVKIGVVFGRGNDTVYIYGVKGVLAVLPANKYIE
ncbi:hypothetical protein HB364_31610 [Pseudoflavitalea sp. X16]|uniref:hypothetical protein n=1 Tax=Paraflavitalea devenefica TaxID=2716334 RepID=UPI00141E1B75|nr:hypothetical protein [Paraflavitalea devenefica]NII29669.1 hypothetical protein [Paraflavitalea devenefica]